MKKHLITVIYLLSFAVVQASTLPKTMDEKTDSIVAVLPLLSGNERLSALSTLINLSAGLPTQKQFTYQYLDEARRQKDVEAESAALLKLTLSYYIQFESDSIFIIGEEAVRFARQHNRYDDMFFAQSEIIRRYKAQGQYLIALRKAEEAYAEAKELQENRFMVRTLSTIGGVLFNMELYEEAIKYWVESIELATQSSQMPNELFILQHYDFLAITLSILNRPQESLNYVESIQKELNRLQRDLPDLNVQHYHFFMEYHRAMAYADMKQPERALEAIRRAEAVYDSQWNEINPSFAAQIDNLYAEYNRAAGNYDKALELFYRNLRFDEEANRPSAVVAWKKHIAQILREKGDYQAAADLYDEVIQKREELNNEQFYAQLNELRTIYELDKSEIESQRRLATLLQQRYIISGLTVTCILLALIVGLTLWSRRRIAEKNRGLYRQIKEQDHLSKELERMKLLYETEGTAEKPLQQHSENGSPQQRQLVAHFHQYMLINDNYLNPEINPDEIASALATNRSYLYEAVKAVTQRTPTEYIYDMRLEEARKMLETRLDLKVDVIAGECGFNSRSVFYRLFRERYKISPTVYRKLKDYELKIHRLDCE